MSRRRRDTLIAGAALVAVTLVTLSPAGAAIRRAMSSRNAATVTGVAAAQRPHPNRLVPLDTRGRLPRATLRPGSGVRGARGAPGIPGAAGPVGRPGAEGPGEAIVYRNPATLGPFADGFTTTAATATDVAPGTWLVIGSATLHRAAGSEFLASCYVTNGLSLFSGGEYAIGGEPNDTGMHHATSLAIGVFQADLRQDVALVCTGTRFGATQAATTVSDATLVIARVPAASSRITEG